MPITDGRLSERRWTWCAAGLLSVRRFLARRKADAALHPQIELVKNDLSSRGPSKVTQELKPTGDAQSSSNGPLSKAQEPLLTSDNLGAAAMGAAPNSLKMPGMAAGSKLSAS